MPRSPHLAAAALALALAAAPAPAAQQATTTFAVTATVSSACTVSASPLAFGAYDSGAATAATSSSSITITCSLTTPYAVGLDLGGNASASIRRMANGANRLTYELYSDASHNTVFGAIGSLLSVSGIGTGLPQSIAVYGRAPAGQIVPVGAYADTVTVTVEY